MTMAAPLLRWRQLDDARRKLLCRAAWWLSVASASVALLPFNRAIRIGCIKRSTERGQSIESIVWAIEAAARRLPWRTMCIEQGIAAQRLLRSSGLEAVLHYGARHRLQDGRLEAHVWGSVGGAVVGNGDTAGFAEVATYK